MACREFYQGVFVTARLHVVWFPKRSVSSWHDGFRWSDCARD